MLSSLGDFLVRRKKSLDQEESGPGCWFSDVGQELKRGLRQSQERTIDRYVIVEIAVVHHGLTGKIGGPERAHLAHLHTPRRSFIGVQGLR